jgi:hypothetical protein
LIPLVVAWLKREDKHYWPMILKQTREAKSNHLGTPPLPTKNPIATPIEIRTEPLTENEKTKIKEMDLKIMGINAACPDF